METEVITIDGPTSSGKNSVGFLLAQKLGYQYIDSGSIYRAGCIFILRQQKELAELILKNNVPLDNVQNLVEVYKNLKIEVKQNGFPKFFANGEDITKKLHDPQVTQLVPVVSAIKEVREAAKEIQYRLVDEKNTVMTGRDIGSEIFPNAKYKFYLNADVKIRAERRYKQLKETDPNITYEKVLQDMEARDNADTTREVSPLRVPKDAIIIDNSNRSVEETVADMLKHIHAQD